MPARHTEATAAKLEAQAERQMTKLASSVLHKADPLDGLDLTNEPPPAAAPAAAAAEDGGKEGGEKAEGGAADADMEAEAEAAEAQAEGEADEKEEPQPVEDEEVVEPMMAGTELGDMLED